MPAFWTCARRRKSAFSSGLDQARSSRTCGESSSSLSRRRRLDRRRVLDGLLPKLSIRTTSTGASSPITGAVELRDSGSETESWDSGIAGGGGGGPASGVRRAP